MPEMLADRTYWRSEDTQRLINEARDSKHELCIALGERLEEAERDFDDRLEEALERARDFEREASVLDDTVYELQLEIAKLEEQIERLKEGNRK